MNVFFTRRKKNLFLNIWIVFYLIISIKNSEIFKEKTSFSVKKSSNNIKYLEYTIKGNNSSINYILSAYNNSNKIERIQLAQSYFGITKLYLNVEDFEDKIYFDLECSQYSCSADRSSQFVDSIKLAKGEPIYYYVNKENEEITFTLKLSSKKANIWAKGQYTLTTELNSNYKKKKIGNSCEIYIVNIDKEEELTFKVKATKGDYINVGYIEYDSCIANTNLKYEGPIITGYLKKNELNKICYNIENNNAEEGSLLGKGIILTKFAFASIIDDKETQNYTFTKGYISHQLNSKTSQVCFTFPEDSQYDNIEEIVYTYKIENVIKKVFINNNPQFNGIFYPRAIAKDSIAAYISHKNGIFDTMSFKLSSFTGFPKMGIVNCINYPLCLEDIQNYEIKIKNINRFSNYNMRKQNDFDNSPISKNQTLFIVECKQSEIINQEDTSNDLNSLCEYNTLIYTNNDVIHLHEDNFFNQYAISNQEHEYKIKLTNKNNVYKVLIDIMIYIGEIVINTENITSLGIDADQYEEINKLYISVKLNKKQLDELNFSIKGVRNTYYTILITFIENEKDTETFVTHKLKTGLSYLVTLDNEINNINSEKIIKFDNERIFDKIPFMVNFYSINCKVEVFSVFEGKNEPIDNFDQFSQEIIDSEEEKYDKNPYLYKIKVKKPDPSTFSLNLCKVYTTSIEMSQKIDNYTRDILLPDNTPQQVMFGNNSRHITFGYTHANFQNDLLIKFNLIHTAKYTVQFYFNSLKRENEEVIVVANNLFYLSHEDWKGKCTDTRGVCYIQIDITFIDVKVNINPILEISVKSMGSNFVSYIPKNQLKIDYVQNNKPQYYYTEIGRSEIGFISINFLRGSGSIYSKIIKKNIAEPEKGANWRGKYELPFEEKEMKTDQFTKKIKIQSDDECKEGCYLLLKVFTDVQEDEKIYDFVNYPYSIFINSYPSYNYNNIPPIRIPIDQYIVGAVTSSQNSISEFYSVWLKYDADLVIIDFQTNAAGLYINANETNPTTENAHFEYRPAGKDIIYSIKKEDILKYYKEEKDKNKGLRDKVLTIGIWANITDSLFTTPFSFAVRLQNNTNDNIEIYRVNSDQKVLCNASLFEPNDNKRKYRCLYVIDYEYIVKFSEIFIYASAQNKIASFKIYANIINSTDYEMGSTKDLNIPSYKNSNFSNEEQKNDFLYITEPININQYFLVSVEIDINTTIELISTFFIAFKEITPNPFSYQLFSIYEDIIFKFPNTFMELVNIICIGGSGEIYWDNKENNKYYLRGRDDRLSITSSKSNKEEHKLKIRATSEPDNFVLIVKYNIRKDDANFDSLNLDKSVNFAYSDSDFPIALYCPLDILNKEEGDYYDVIFSFLKLEPGEQNYSKSYETYPFQLLGFIVKESVINSAKLMPGTSPQINSETIEGIYDNGIRAGLIRIKEKNLKKSDEKLYLYLKIDKTNEFRDKIFDVISFESTVFHRNSKIAVSELANLFGYLDEGQNEIIYVLRNDKTKDYMNIEFSCENDNVFMFIDNRTDLVAEKERLYGKQYYHLLANESDDEYMNLIVKRNDDKGKDKKLFFLFRYSFSEKSNSKKYIIDDTRIDVNQTKRNNIANYTIKLSPVNNYNLYDITYIVRLIYDRKMPDKATIVITPGEQKVKEFYNPIPQDGKLTFEITNANSKISYIQVVAQIKEKEEVDYLSYDLQNNFNIINMDNIKENDSDDDDNDTLIILIIGGVLVVIAVILVFLICKYKRKNKDLLEKVNKVSFSSDRQNDNENEDLLLYQ